MPPAIKTWATFGDVGSSRLMAAANEREEFKIVSLYFHAQMALIAQGLSLDQIKNMFVSTLPPYLQDGPPYEQNHAEKIFLDAHNRIEDLLVERIRGYANLWLSSSGGLSYKDKQLHAK